MSEDYDNHISGKKEELKSFLEGIKLLPNGGVDPETGNIKIPQDYDKKHNRLRDQQSSLLYECASNSPVLRSISTKEKIKLFIEAYDFDSGRYLRDAISHAPKIALALAEKINPDKIDEDHIKTAMYHYKTTPFVHMSTYKDLVDTLIKKTKTEILEKCRDSSDYSLIVGSYLSENVPVIEELASRERQNKHGYGIGDANTAAAYAAEQNSKADAENYKPKKETRHTARASERDIKKAREVYSNFIKGAKELPYGWDNSEGNIVLPLGNKLGRYPDSDSPDYKINELRAYQVLLLKNYIEIPEAFNGIASSKEIIRTLSAGADSTYQAYDNNKYASAFDDYDGRPVEIKSTISETLGNALYYNKTPELALTLAQKIAPEEIKSEHIILATENLRNAPLSAGAASNNINEQIAETLSTKAQNEVLEATKHYKDDRGTMMTNSPVYDQIQKRKLEEHQNKPHIKALNGIKKLFTPDNAENVNPTPPEQAGSEQPSPMLGQPTQTAAIISPKIADHHEAGANIEVDDDIELKHSRRLQLQQQKQENIGNKLA